MEYVELAKLISNYGMGVMCLATLIGLHIYNVRVTLPTLTEKSNTQIALLVAVFREELAAERRQCHDDHLALAASIVEVQKALTQLLERQHSRR